MPNSSGQLPEILAEDALADLDLTSGTARQEIAVTQHEHAGPLPDAHWFEAIERLHPGATEKLLDDYVADREHARTMERQQLELDAKNLSSFIGYQNRRLAIVGAMAVLIVAASIVLIAVGKPVYGLALIVAELAALVAVFIGARSGDSRAESASGAG